jgi:hypothetical protein
MTLASDTYKVVGNEVFTWDYYSNRSIILGISLMTNHVNAQQKE